MEISSSFGKNSYLTYQNNILDAINSGSIKWSDLDNKSKEKLIECFIPKIYYIVQRFLDRLPNSVEKEDLISAATLGLLEGLRNFNTDYNTKLESYVDYRIKGAILDELRKQDFFSRNFRKKIQLLEKVKDKLSRTGNDNPSLEELQKITGFDKKELIQVLEASENTLWIPLEDIRPYVYQKEKISESDPSYVVIKEEIIHKLSSFIEELRENERLVLSLYYKEELTMKEIAEVLNISEGRVSQIHKQAIQKLRKKLRDFLED